MMTPAYFKDIEVIDNRLQKLELSIEKLYKLVEYLVRILTDDCK